MTELEMLKSPFLARVILPFLLIFVVVYALLERTEILGKDKKAANVLVALVIGLLFVLVDAATGFTVKLIPIVAVFIMILLCIYLVFGFIGIHERTGIKIALGIIFGVALIFAVLWALGLTGKIAALAQSELFISIATLIAVVGGAIAVVTTKKRT